MCRYMLRALELATRGAGAVSPNPMVGAVIVCDGEIIGEGWHQKYGEPHAEVNAIASVADESLLSRSTMYVTLEPCSHWGKTPPCSDLIIEKKIPRVVVGSIDLYHEVCGGGIARMRAAGIEVEIGVMERECDELNKRFFKAQTDGRPYIILKWAETSDGFIDVCRPNDTSPAWMTGKECKKLVHRWRAEEDAIMVGRNTVVMDNPELTVREVDGRNPLRITFDQYLTLSIDYKVFNDEAPTLLITSRENGERATSKFEHCRNVEIETVDYSQDVLSQVVNMLSCRRVHSLFVEGGRELLQSFIDADLWDEARVFKSQLSAKMLYPKILTPQGISAPYIDSKFMRDVTVIDGVELLLFKREEHS